MNNNKYLHEAKILFASGQLEKSIDFFTVAEEKGCETVDLYLSRGATEMALGLHRDSQEDFTHVLQ